MSITTLLFRCHCQTLWGQISEDLSKLDYFTAKELKWNSITIIKHKVPIKEIMVTKENITEKSFTQARKKKLVKTITISLTTVK